MHNNLAHVYVDGDKRPRNLIRTAVGASLAGEAAAAVVAISGGADEYAAKAGAMAQLRAVAKRMIRDGEQPEADLRWHLIARHCHSDAAHLPVEDLVLLHQAEHRGVGALGDHDEADMGWDAAAAVEVLTHDLQQWAPAGRAAREAVEAQG